MSFIEVNEIFSLSLANAHFEKMEVLKQPSGCLKR
jgi:hypothetical protein